MKLLTLANTLPALRKTTVKHYRESPTADFSKFKKISLINRPVCRLREAAVYNFWIARSPWQCPLRVHLGCLEV